MAEAPDLAFTWPQPTFPQPTSIPTFAEYLKDKPFGQTYYPPGTPDPYMERYKREYQELYGVSPVGQQPTTPFIPRPSKPPQLPSTPQPTQPQLPSIIQPTFPPPDISQPTREQTIRQTYQPYQGYQEQQTPQRLGAYLQPQQPFQPSLYQQPYQQPYQPPSYQQPYQQPSLRQSLQPYQQPYQQPFDWSQMAEQWKPRINRSPSY